MRKLILIGILIAVLQNSYSYAQDPSFSQFFASPLNINPALTANINADWRAISNMRDQWIGPASPYATGTVSFDSKMLQKKIPNVEEKNFMGIGTMLMYDYSMGGVQKSIYASLNLAYNVQLAEGNTTHRLAAGFGATYARRTIDYSRVNFEEQWIGLGGFDTNLPTGEPALNQLKGYVSANVGLVYTFQTDNSNLDVGVAAYHVNKPKQTFLDDPKQYLAIREVAHANFETFINERAVLNTNAIFQRQAETNYYQVGAALGYFLSDNQTILNAGVWYWARNAIVPYLGLSYDRFQFGLSTDVTITQLNKARRKPNTFELSLIIRGERGPSGIIPCPWK
jgi:type IX secretion system PorP/SprF family membrane protein